MRIPLMVVVSLVLATTFAQQPVTSPVYYLTTAPRLEPGAPVSGVLDARSGRNFKDGSYLDVMVLYGDAGEHVEILASSVEFDTYLTLFAPDGTVLEANDDDPLDFGTDAAIRATLPETGRYLVVVSGFGEWDVGHYTVTRSGRAATGVHWVDVPSHTYATLDGASAHFRFTMDEAGPVAIEARSSSFDTTLELFDEHGYSIAYNDDAPYTDIYTTDSALALILSPGTYDAVVRPFFADTVGDGTLELEVTRLVPAR